MKVPYRRRIFLKDFGVSFGALSFGGAIPSVLSQTASLANAPGANHDRVLVVVEMAGGNDGLNSVVPHSDPAYKRARPKLGISRADCLAVTDEIGLHPSLRGFADRLEDGRFAVVQGVGYPNPNRSHFESMDIWHTCVRKEDSRTAGWLGQFLDQSATSDSGDPPAIHFGEEEQPFALRSREISIPSVKSLKNFRLSKNGAIDMGKMMQSFADASAETENDLLGFVRQSTSSAVDASRRLEMADVGEANSDDADSALGKKLQTISKLIVSEMSTRVYYVRIDGFDTHANQPDAHAALLRQVSDAVSNFVQGLDQMGHGERTLVMCFSEFGRRVAENASDGTDHGTAGPVFFAGGQIRPGLIGPLPSLVDLQDGDLRFHTDFRQVYATVLEDWFGCDSEPVLRKRFETIDLFKSV